MKNRLEIVLILFLVSIVGGLIALSSSINSIFPVILIAAIIGIIFFYFLLQDLRIGVYLITFLLPFEQIGGFEIAGMNVRLSQLVFVATFIAWIISGLYHRSLKIKIDYKLFLLAAFSIVSIASFANSINLFRSVQIFIFILFVFAVYIFFSSYELDKKVLKNMVLVLFASMSLTCFFGLFQFAGDMIGLPPAITGLEEGYTKAVFGFPRIQSTANEPLNFANYLVLPLSIAFSFFASKSIKMTSLNRYEFKRLSFQILALGTIVMIMTFSRGGWGAIALSFLIIGAKYLKDLLTFRNITLVVGMVIISMIGIFSIAKITNAPFTLTAIAERINVTDFSARERVRTTQEGMEGWEDHKLLGIGLGAYGPYVAKYRNIEPEGGWQTVNNEYSELLIETGILGVSLICIFWLSFFLPSILGFKPKNSFDRTIYIGMLAALAGMLLQYISFSTLYVFHLWFLLGILNNNYFYSKNE